MAYTYEQVFAADPSNPSNVAQNASITIFAPGDGTMTPLTITDPDGQPLSNPLPVNANGFGSAFAHATLDRVAWAGGGFTGFFTSYEGMKQVALDAQAAAEQAAATAGADATAVANAAVATVIADADAAASSAATAEANALASATAAANSAALVGAPADTAIAAAVSNSASETKAALNTAITSVAVPRWKPNTVYTLDYAVVNPSGDIVRAVAHTSGATYDATKWNLSTSYASSVPTSAAKALQTVRPRKTLLQTFQAGHGFVLQASGGGNGSLNATTNGPVIGTQHVTINPGSSTLTDNLYRFDMAAVDFTNKDLAILVKADDVTKLGTIAINLMTGPSFNNNYAFSIPPSYLESGKYVWVTLPFPTTGSGTPNRASITGYQLNFKRQGADPTSVHIQAIAAAPIQAGFTNGCVTFDLDDGYASHYTKALPALAKYGYPADVYPVVEQINGGVNAMTVGQLQELQNTHGWMIGAHADTWAHHNVPLANQTPEELKAAFKANREWLSNNGLTGSDFFAYPGGYFDGANTPIARNYFAMGRSAGNGRETLPASDFHKVRVFALGNTVTLAQAQAEVDKAVATNSHIILLAHDLVASAPSGPNWLATDFASLVTYVSTKNTAVKTMAEVFATR